MATTQEILKAAQELGNLIATHEAASRFEKAATKLQGDVEAQRVMTDVNRLAQKLAEKEESGKPIEVAEKRQLESLQMNVIRNATLREFQMAQMDYLDLMRRVDEAISGMPASQGPAPGAQAAASPLANVDLSSLTGKK